MGVKKGQVLELTVSDMAFGGRGLAKPDGFSVFIDKAVVMDRVSVRIFKKKKNYAEGRVVDIIEPSPDRIAPRCEYSGYCGGCKWQFLDYKKQLQYKTEQVAEALEHIGLIKDVPVHPAIASDAVFGYRNKMEFSCSDKRWLLPEEMGEKEIKTGFGIGLHVPGTFHKVIDIKTCHIQPELGNSILEDVRTYIKDSGVPVYGLRSQVGFWRFLMLRHSAAFDRWMVNIVTSKEDREIVQPLADLLIEKYLQIDSVVNNITSRKAGIAVGEYEITLGGNRCLKDKLGPYEFEISANSFFQTNTRGAENLYKIVKSYAGLSGNENVLDLYSGTGTIPIWLSDSAKQVVGIEINEDAVADAHKNCQRNNIANCSFIKGDIKDVLLQIKKEPDVMIPDVIIIDPPRAGMHKDVVLQVLDMAPEKIVYVSCNPSTLARDIGMMKDRYSVIEVQPVDMFPHTYHIESVARLERRE
jgi:23S rRNA (uracil1939-C5)-methyltransferase